MAIMQIKYLNVSWYHSPIAVELVKEHPQHWEIESLEGLKTFSLRVHKRSIVLFDTYADALAHLQIQQRAECDK
jgi:hypothetical protein